MSSLSLHPQPVLLNSKIVSSDKWDRCAAFVATHRKVLPLVYSGILGLSLWGALATQPKKSNQPINQPGVAAPTLTVRYQATKECDKGMKMSQQPDGSLRIAVRPGCVITSAPPALAPK